MNDLALMIGKGFVDVDKRFEDVDKRFADVSNKISEIKSDVGEMKTDIADIKVDLNHRVHVFDHKSLEIRVERLEERAGIARRR